MNILCHSRIDGHIQKNFIETVIVLDKARNERNRVSEENVGDYRLDVLRANNDVHMMFNN